MENFQFFLVPQKSIFLTSMSSKITSHDFESGLNMFCKISRCHQIPRKLNLDTQIALCDHHRKSGNSDISRLFKSTSVYSDAYSVRGSVRALIFLKFEFLIPNIQRFFFSTGQRGKNVPPSIPRRKFSVLGTYQIFQKFFPR